MPSTPASEVRCIYSLATSCIPHGSSQPLSRSGSDSLSKPRRTNDHIKAFQELKQHVHPFTRPFSRYFEVRSDLNGWKQVNQSRKRHTAGNGLVGRRMTSNALGKVR
ncbi:hypothetical protein LshimejAT787_3000010 [Lyophyllum shimeji]|uniref:Uncharacterized protein n=1 Tax=Lyophyllum shimeji TaxID=47721 RepID=A0A9P3UV50_LYOSH|nr:hypothetical protein LshimejAT787_3000010 [Lyophyllum shimeji]